MDAYPNNLRDLQAPTAQSFISITDLLETVEDKNKNIFEGNKKETGSVAHSPKLGSDNLPTPSRSFLSV